MPEKKARVVRRYHAFQCVDLPQVIDPEFASYGPMGFDLGAYIANLLLAYCAVPGNGQGSDYGDWLLDEVRAFMLLCDVLTYGVCEAALC